MRTFTSWAGSRSPHCSSRFCSLCFTCCRRCRIRRTPMEHPGPSSKLSTQRANSRSSSHFSLQISNSLSLSAMVTFESASPADSASLSCRRNTITVPFGSLPRAHNSNSISSRRNSSGCRTLILELHGRHTKTQHRKKNDNKNTGNT